MSNPTSHGALDRYATISDLGTNVRRLIDKSSLPAVGLLILGSAILWFEDHPGSTSFMLIASGSLLVWSLWRTAGVGLPIVPMLALQNLIAYGLPIIVSNESVMGYRPTDMTSAGTEVFVFSAALAVSWRLGMQFFSASSTRSYALRGFEGRNLGRLVRIAFGLAGTATLYALLGSLGLLDRVFSALPQGSYSIVSALVSAASACGFFLAAMVLGKGGMTGLQPAVFWLMLAFNCYISATSLLLSSSVTYIISVFVGLFWSTGRVPWRYLVIVSSAFAFLNLGKIEMREHYWSLEEGEPATIITLADTPEYYQEWIAASYGALLGAEDTSRSASMTALSGRGQDVKSGQSLLNRINSLQNILFVIDAMQSNRIPPLGGATYALIPPLMLPRVFWPEKPRTHAGQILLNVHFGRQDIRSTFQTYIAWGLIAEAYGNFGPITGSALIGVILGFLLAWLEKFTAPKLLLSLEGFLAFALLLGIANSSEMVASILVTSLFQSLVPIVIACSPFVASVIPPQTSAEQT